jgi:hypothetical protein
MIARPARTAGARSLKRFDPGNADLEQASAAPRWATLRFPLRNWSAATGIFAGSDGRDCSMVSTCLDVFCTNFAEGPRRQAKRHCAQYA